jgi:hypothetical protein
MFDTASYFGNIPRQKEREYIRNKKTMQKFFDGLKKGTVVFFE